MQFPANFGRCMILYAESEHSLTVSAYLDKGAFNG
jgi:hypothetical protein